MDYDFEPYISPLDLEATFQDLYPNGEDTEAWDGFEIEN